MMFKINSEPFSTNTFFKIWSELDPFCVGTESKPEETSRWIENPEWKQQQIRNKINHNNSLIGIYEDNLIKLKNEIKELEKELNGK